MAAPTLFQQFAEHEARRAEAQAAREAAEARTAAAVADAAAPAKKKAALTPAAPAKVKTVAYETLAARLAKVRMLDRLHHAPCLARARVRFPAPRAMSRS